jgi:hypothetical protein
MLMVAVGAAIYGAQMRAMRMKEVAIQLVASKGGTLYVDRYNDDVAVSFAKSADGTCGCGQTHVVSPTGSLPFNDSDLPMLDWLRLTSIDFTDSSVTPPAIEKFKSRHGRCEVR